MFLLLYALKDLGAQLNMDPVTEDEWQRYEGYLKNDRTKCKMHQN